MYGFPKLSIRGLDQIYENRLEALPDKPKTSIKYHRKAKNPHLSRYEEIWVEKLKSSSSMSKLCSITDMVQYMIKEGEKMMKGSVSDDDLFIVHDALVLITEKETTKWIRENNYSLIGCCP